MRNTQLIEARRVEFPDDAALDRLRRDAQQGTYQHFRALERSV